MVPAKNSCFMSGIRVQREERRNIFYKQQASNLAVLPPSFSNSNTNINKQKAQLITKLSICKHPKLQLRHIYIAKEWWHCTCIPVLSGQELTIKRRLDDNSGIVLTLVMLNKLRCHTHF